MNFRSLIRNLVILAVLFVGFMVLIAALGANVGPVELLILLVAFVTGVVLVIAGSRKRASGVDA